MLPGVTSGSGDLEGGHDIAISNKVYNSLKAFEVKAGAARLRLHDKEECVCIANCSNITFARIATNLLALDANTRLLVFKLIGSGALEQLNGCVSAGKVRLTSMRVLLSYWGVVIDGCADAMQEAVVFHATRRADPEDTTSALLECAVKIFKTTLSEFKDRSKFLVYVPRACRKAPKLGTSRRSD